LPETLPNWGETLPDYSRHSHFDWIFSVNQGTFRPKVDKRLQERANGSNNGPCLKVSFRKGTLLPTPVSAASQLQPSQLCNGKKCPVCSRGRMRGGGRWRRASSLIAGGVPPPAPPGPAGGACRRGSGARKASWRAWIRWDMGCLENAALKGGDAPLADPRCPHPTVGT
jgi:hypothetical protein